MKPKSDVSPEEIWGIRRQMATELGDDPHKASACYHCRQKQAGV
jgi:hypothetical protein